MIWKDPFTQRCFEHLSNTDWSTIEIIDAESQQKMVEEYAFSIKCSQHSTHAFSIGKQRFFFYSLYNKWNITSMMEDMQVLGYLNLPLDMSTEKMIEKFQSLFHPLRQKKMKKWIEFFKNTATNLNPTFVYATYDNTQKCFTVFESIKGTSKLQATDHSINIPNNACNKLHHLLKTTIHADLFGYMSDEQTVSINPPKTAHEQMKAMQIGEFFSENGFDTVLNP